MEGIIPKQTLYVKNLYEKISVTGTSSLLHLWESQWQGLLHTLSLVDMSFVIVSKGPASSM
jgi:hypothetical protein